SEAGSESATVSVALAHVRLQRGTTMRNQRTSTRLFLLLAIAVAGCAGGGSAVIADFSTDAGTYAPGEEMEIALRNQSDRALGYNICYAFLLLQRDMEGEWQETQVGLGPEPDAPCTAQLNLLEPTASTQ